MITPTETVLISEHQVNVYEALSSDWRSSLELAVVANVMPRTARRHLKAFTEHGIVEMQRTFPAYSYRLNGKRKLGNLEARINAAQGALA